MSGLETREIADRIWVVRDPGDHGNLTAIGSERGLVVVDPGGPAHLDAVRSLGPIDSVVFTHRHVDGADGADEADGGDVQFAGLALHAHDAAMPGGAVDTFSSARVLDLGDRGVELVHPGRGHTAGDVVVHVPDAGVVLAGGLVAAPAAPSYGVDCWPMEWPSSLDVLLSMTTSSSGIVTASGDVVDRDAVEQQRGEIGIVAETIRDLAGRGVPLGLAAASAEWPFAADTLTHAIRRGYEHLPRSQKRLPLV